MTELLLYLLKALIGKAIGDEVVASTHGLSQRIVRWSAFRLGTQQERYTEQWLADLSDRPTALRRLLFSIDCFRAACIIRHEYAYGGIRFTDRIVTRFVDVLVSFVALFLLSPVITVVSIAVLKAQRFRGPVLTNIHRSKTGRRYFLEIGNAFQTYVNERQTSVGRFIEQTSIFLIPQFWRVLIGKATLVGRRPLLLELKSSDPHPEMKDFVFELESENPPVAKFLARTPGILYPDDEDGDVAQAGIISLRTYFRIIFRAVRIVWCDLWRSTTG